MATISRWLGRVGLILALGLGGCGRPGFEKAIPADQAVTFSAAPDHTESATGSLQNLGTAALLKLEGHNFQTTGAYSVWVQRSSGRLNGGVGTAPFALPVGADGTVNFFNTFSLASVFNEPLRLAIYYHPNGDLTDLAGAQLAATAPLPAQF